MIFRRIGTGVDNLLRGVAGIPAGTGNSAKRLIQTTGNSLFDVFKVPINLFRKKDKKLKLKALPNLRGRVKATVQPTARALSDLLRLGVSPEVSKAMLKNQWRSLFGKKTSETIEKTEKSLANTLKGLFGRTKGYTPPNIPALG